MAKWCLIDGYPCSKWPRWTTHQLMDRPSVSRPRGRWHESRVKTLGCSPWCTTGMALKLVHWEASLKFRHPCMIMFFENATLYESKQFNMHFLLGRGLRQVTYHGHGYVQELETPPNQPHPNIYVYVMYCMAQKDRKSRIPKQAMSLYLHANVS